MTDDNTEEAPTAEVPVDAQSSSGPEHGANQAEAGSSALQELLEISRQARLQELREAPTGALKTDEVSHSGAKSPKRTTAKSKPKAEARGASQRIAQRVARRTVGRLVSGTSVNTAPVPIVTALKGSPYKAPVQASEPNEDEARMVLDLAADIAAIMMRAGSGTTDIEVSVIAACAAFGLTTAQVDLTSNTLTVHYSTSDGRLMTVMRVNRGESIHFAKLGSVHKLVTELVAGNLGFNDARSRLDAIRSQRRPYQDWFVTGAWGLMVGSLVVLLGGGAIAAGLGILMSIFIRESGKYIARTSLPSFFITTLQAAIATLVAMVAGNFGIIESPQYLVAAGIVLLLPTQSLYASVQDALTNFPLTAAGKMVGVVLTLAGIVSGLALGVVTGEALGLDPIEVLVPKTDVHVLTAIVSLVAATVVSMAGVVGMQSTRRFILPSAFVGLASYITMTALTIIAIDNVLACLLAATVTGFLARPLSLRLGAPAIVLMIPAIYTLLQGLSIFTAVYQIVADSETTSFAVGLSSLFTAILANAALAVGAVLGSYLARPLKNLKADAVEKTAESARSSESTITIDGTQPRD